MSFEKCLRKANSIRNIKQTFFFVLSGKSDGDRTGIGRAEHLEKAHFVKTRVVFFTKFESDGERTGTDGERTGNGRVGIC